MHVEGTICPEGLLHLWVDSRHWFSSCCQLVVLPTFALVCGLVILVVELSFLLDKPKARGRLYNYIDVLRLLAYALFGFGPLGLVLLGNHIAVDIGVDCDHVYFLCMVLGFSLISSFVLHLEVLKGVRENALSQCLWICWLVPLGIAGVLPIKAIVQEVEPEGVPVIIGLSFQDFGTILALLMGVVSGLMTSVFRAGRGGTVHPLEAPLITQHLELDGSISPRHFPTSTRSSSSLALEEGRGEGGEPPPLAELEAGILSILTFSWLNQIMALGRRRPLQQGDLPEVHPGDTAAACSERFLIHWREEVRIWRGEKPGKVSLTRALRKAFQVHFWISALFKLVNDLTTFLSPVLLERILVYLKNTRDPEKREAWYVGYACVVAMFFSATVQTFALHQYFHRCYRLGIHLKAAVTTEVYRKSLRIASGMAGKPQEQQSPKTKGEDDGEKGTPKSPPKGAVAVSASSGALASSSSSSSSSTTQLQEGGKEKPKEKEKGSAGKSTGEIVNLMSVDGQRLQDLMSYFHTLWSGPLQITLSLVLLWRHVGVAVLAGAGIMALSIPLTLWVSKQMQTIQKKIMKIKDERIKMTNECLAGMKIIKLYGWEQSMGDKIGEIRENELRLLWRYRLTQVFSRTLFQTVPLLVSIGTFTCYVLIPGNELTAEKVFPALVLFNILRFPMAMLPFLINNTLEAAVSIKRLQDFFASPETDPLPDIPRGRPAVVPGMATVDVEGATLKWPDGSALLNDISFKTYPGMLTAIVGSTGCGKSGLLASLIRDVAPREGSVQCFGSIAYASQVPWIQNATVRQNICFGKAYDREFYRQVLRACALEDDLRVLPAGDATEIGEKGINLSGGQKARISLARAAYQQSDVYLLDDVLSAVDSHVAHHLFTECIRGLLKDKTVILVTHKLALLPQTDQIVFLRDKRAAYVGNFAGFRQLEDDFAALVAEEDEEERQMEIEMERLLTKDREPSREVSRGGSGLPPRPPGPGGIERTLSRDSRHTAAGSPNQPLLPSSPPSFPVSTAVESVNRRERTLSEDTSTLPPVKARSRLSSKDELNLLKKEVDKKEKDKQAGGGDGKTGGGSGGGLIEKEFLEGGAVSRKVYLSYLRNAGGWWMLFFMMLGLSLAQTSSVMSNVWLNYWSDSQQQKVAVSTTIGLSVYVFLTLMQSVLTCGQLMISSWSSQIAARVFHNKMVQGILRCPMYFFDTTPLGRIVNRFSKDIYVVDETLNACLQSYLLQLALVIATVGVIVAAQPWFLVCIIPIGAIYYSAQRYYIPSSRQLKRLDSVLKSPVFAHFSETLDGVSTIRAFRMQQVFSRENETKLDMNNRAYYLSVASNRWLAVRLEFVGNLATCFCALLCVVNISQEAGMDGVAITYALNITQTLNWMVRMACELETNIVSVERVKEYAEDSPQEAPLVIENHRPRPEWPDKGEVCFENLQLRYRPNLPLVLKGLTLRVAPGERVGLVGRTGAGKSSILLALLRLVEHSGGFVEVDGVNISLIGLHDLRHRFSIIPQDPVLFTETVRFNLDPFNTKTDAEILRALDRSHLTEKIQSLDNGLDSVVEEGGRNFSLGERQLLCMGRALLRRSRVLLLDEATSAVDQYTDKLIQDTIRSEFIGCTILTIAHRIDTILDYDKILVMDQGRVSEFDSPAALLQKEISIFRSLALAANIPPNWHALQAEAAQQTAPTVSTYMDPKTGSGMISKAESRKSLNTNLTETPEEIQQHTTHGGNSTQQPQVGFSSAASFSRGVGVSSLNHRASAGTTGGAQAHRQIAASPEENLNSSSGGKSYKGGKGNQ